MFTDACIYWIHRFLHHKTIYKYIHKDHHKWKVPTPFASHAFHPLDGFLQSCPYHIYPFLFPLHKWTYLCLFVFVNIWTVSIHDGDYRVPHLLQPFVNGSAHHTDHHLYYNYNYGQFFTLWDRIGGSFRNPSSFEGCGPIQDIIKKDSSNGVSRNGAMKKENWFDFFKKDFDCYLMMIPFENLFQKEKKWKYLFNYMYVVNVRYEFWWNIHICGFKFETIYFLICEDIKSNNCFCVPISC